MRKYESFNPNIPDTEDVITDPIPSSQQVELPELTPDIAPASDEVPSQKRKNKKSRKPEKKKEIQTKNSRGFVVSVKEWAGGQTVRWLTGLILGFFGIYLCVAFLSYVTNCVHDQSEITNTPVGYSGPIVNAAGEGGARLADILIDQTFGLGSIVIVFWLLAMSAKLLVGRPRFKSVNFTIKCLVALITLSLIVGLATIGVDTTVNWGGYHGRYVNEFVIHFIGWPGAGLLCLLLTACFVVICMRDLILWVIRLRRKRAEKRRKIAEEEAARLERERELEEMRRAEEAESAAAVAPAEPVVDSFDQVEEESPDGMHHVSFGEETGLYTTLPDFEDEPDAVSNYMLREEEPTSGSGDINNENENHDGSEVVDSKFSDSGVATDLTESEGSEDSADSSDSPNSEEGVNSESTDRMVVNINQIAQAEKATNTADSELPGMKPYHFPPAELLREGVAQISVDPAEQLENKEKIKKTLLDFGIPILSIEATVGPTVTLYEIVPDRGVKINRIRNLVDDIALSLAAVGVRIIAPIPGKGTVGIEVANKDAQTVSMRTVIQSRKYQESHYKLPIALGSTISNEVFIADLAKMPHLLVAGATGQGKSVGLNAIIASLLYRKSPDELKFVMIDPKMVEFSLYAKIENHYLAKIPNAEDAIITDMDKVVATLSSLCVEMDDRYQLLKTAHTRNIEEYNDKIKAKSLSPLDGHRFLPYIVVVVDEFSDLIMTAGKEVEIPIARLAQKARAVGMHVIIATQRPSTNVITGIIKANFPARIAFKVSSGVDSKTILDTPGAQQLIGRGDMLISNNAPMVRVQCAFIDTPEVEAICDFISQQPGGTGAYNLPEPVVTGANGESDSELGNNFGDKDPLFDEIARLIVSSNTASTSSLQRRYSIGYNRAGKIMDQLEAAGIVGPAHGGKPRDVLVDAITLESILHG